MKFPRTLYVKIDGVDRGGTLGEQWLHPAEEPSELVDTNERVKVARYTLSDVTTYEGVVRPAKE